MNGLTKSMQREENLQRQKKFWKHLLQLRTTHPELPIVPMVNSEIVEDDVCAYWIGSWSTCELNKYVTGEEHVHFFDLGDWASIEETLSDFYGWKRWTAENMEDLPDAELRWRYKNLPWIEAIIVYINMPED